MSKKWKVSMIEFTIRNGETVVEINRRKQPFDPKKPKFKWNRYVLGKSRSDKWDCIMHYGRGYDGKDTYTKAPSVYTFEDRLLVAYYISRTDKGQEE